MSEVQKSLGADISNAAAEGIVSSVLEVIKKGIKKYSNVHLIGFGTFSLFERAERDGRYPKKREKIRIKSAKGVKFRSGSGVKAVL